VFFQLRVKQPVVLSNQPIVLLLGVLKKVEKYFGLVDLTVKPKQSVVSCFTDCFFENPNKIQF